MYWFLFSIWHKTKYILEEGTLKNFFAALTGGARITKEEKEELKAYLDSLDDEGRQWMKEIGSN